MDDVEKAAQLLRQAVEAEFLWSREVTGDINFRIERYLCKGGWRCLPILPCPVLGIQLGGKKVLALNSKQSSDDSAFSIPNVSLIIPATTKSYWNIGSLLDFVIIYFRGETLDQYRQLIADIDSPVALEDSLTGSIIKQLIELLLDAGEASKQQIKQRKLHINALSSCFFYQVCHQLENPSEHINLDTATTKYPSVYEVVSYIKENLSSKLSIAELAEKSGFQQSQFRNVFRQVTGLSPGQFVIKSRLERAHELLTNTDMSLISLATGLGFSSQSHLTKAFKNHFGVTPPQVRLQNH